MTEKEISMELAKALYRQMENMAFVLNHIPVPEQWFEKFNKELSEDYRALSRFFLN